MQQEEWQQESQQDSQQEKEKNKKIAFEINTTSGNSYRELGRRMISTGIPSYEFLGKNFFLSLFDTKDNLLNPKHVSWVRTSVINKKQVRDEVVDTTHAKNLNFTLEGPEQQCLNTPPIGFREAGKLIVPVGLHRSYRAIDILQAQWMPIIIMPDEIIREIPNTVILDACRLDNSVMHQQKPSSLSCDAESVLSAFKQSIIELCEDYKKLSEKEREYYFLRMFKDKETCRTEYPDAFRQLRELASKLSSAHPPGQIRNHIFSNTLRSGFRAYNNGKIDQVKESLSKNYTLDKNNVFCCMNGKKFEITLLEGGNQQEQNVLARLPKKRIHNEVPIVGVICGTGSSKSSALQGRIRALEMFLPLAVLQGFNVVRELLTANYKDGFMKYPQFIEGLCKEEVEIGGNKYEVTCPVESDSDKWEYIYLKTVISFLETHYKKNPTSTVFVDDEDTRQSIIELCFPKGSTMSIKESTKKRAKKQAKM